MSELGYLSVTASGCARTICILLDQFSATLTPPNEVQTSVPENATSVSIVTLALAMLESIVGHTEFQRNLVPASPTKAPRSIWTRLNVLFPAGGHEELKANLEEASAQRDALMHGHLWDAAIEYDESLDTLKFTRPPTLVHGHGDEKFDRVLDPVTLRSKRLGLNLYPPRIWRRDAGVVLTLALDTAAAIQSDLVDRIQFRDGIHRQSTIVFYDRVKALAALPVA